jgi:DNA-binding NarL/FixJ family response regulator
VRVLIAEDLVLLREGLSRLLSEHGFEVVAQAEDAPEFLRKEAAHRPDLAVVDIRMPPGYRDEGLRAALEARARRPGLAVLMLSQYVEPVYAAELLADGRGGVGYLLKDRVSEVRAFAEAARRVTEGGTALDPEVVAQMVAPQLGGQKEELAGLTPRELEVLGLVAEGRSNTGIAEALVITPGAVEKHITAIFGKLGLPATGADHRRVLAVLAHLRGGST